MEDMNLIPVLHDSIRRCLQQL